MKKSNDGYSLYDVGRNNLFPFLHSLPKNWRYTMSVENFSQIHDTYHNIIPHRIFVMDFEQDLQLNKEELEFEIIDARWQYLNNMSEINNIAKCQGTLTGLILLLGHLTVSIMDSNHSGSEYEEAYDCLHKSVNLLMRICIKKLQPAYSPEDIKEKMSGMIQYWISGSFPSE